MEQREGVAERRVIGPERHRLAHDRAAIVKEKVATPRPETQRKVMGENAVRLFGL